MIRVGLLLACMGFVGCGSTTVQNQAQVANTVALAANQAKPFLEKGYAAALKRCTDEAPERVDAVACRVKVDHDWKRIELGWMGLQRAQNEWATALEQGSTHLDDYVRWFLIAYCQLRHDMPEGVSLPDVALATCEKAP